MSVKISHIKIFEHIVIDDGSTEPIKNVIQTYLMEYYLQQEINME